MIANPLTPIAMLAASSIAAGIALMVFDGARKSKLLEVREGWAHGLRNDLALVLALAQKIAKKPKEAASTGTQGDPPAEVAPDQKTVDELAVRLYRAKLRLRSGRGHVKGLKEVASLLTGTLTEIERDLLGFHVQEAPKASLKDAQAAGNASADERTLGAASAASRSQRCIDLYTQSEDAINAVWDDIKEEGKVHKGPHFWFGLLLLIAGAIPAYTVWSSTGAIASNCTSTSVVTECDPAPSAANSTPTQAPAEPSKRPG